jgi:hypothetical protein
MKIDMRETKKKDKKKTKNFRKKMTKINDLMSRWENAMMKEIQVRGADITKQIWRQMKRAIAYDILTAVESENVEKRVKSFMNTGMRRDEGAWLT